MHSITSRYVGWWIGREDGNPWAWYRRGGGHFNKATRLRRYRATTGDGYRYALFFPRSCIGTLYVSRKVMAAIAEMIAVALVKMAT